MAHPGGELAMEDVKSIVDTIERGDAETAERLLPQVYLELRRLAAARLAGQPIEETLDPTSLVHEAYLRLVRRDPARPFNGRAHFFAAAAEAMHHTLVDRARRRARLRRGGGRARVDLDTLHPAAPLPDETLIALDEALAALRDEDPAKADLVRLRFFGGLTLEEAGALLGLSRATASRHWAFARAWLYDAISREDAAS
jgi:RNA polymerase sigma factor (TIGR02999 family)